MRKNIIIIGAGIVGLASALRLLEKNPDLSVQIIEKESGISKHQSGNNSGVIHSGIYYKPGSLRAKNCIDGYHQMLEFCEQHQIDYEITGKIIVATRDTDLPSLHQVYDKGVANGLEGLKLMGLEEMREKEPHVFGIEAIWVPQAGIVDYRRVADKYLELIQAKGAEVHFNTKVSKIIKHSDKVVVETDRGEFESDIMINCAGLYSDKMAKQTHDLKMQILPFRGEYYKLRPEKEYLCKNLIYPAPDPEFPWLGVHFTRMKRGGVEAGPNAVLAFRREGYRKTDFNWSEFAETIGYPGFRKMATKYWRQGLEEYYRSFSKGAFTKALQRLMPEITEDDLIDGGAGVRALACADDGGLIDDFLFYDSPQVINVCNAPSPAATSSLSIGHTISDMALQRYEALKG